MSTIIWTLLILFLLYIILTIIGIIYTYKQVKFYMENNTIILDKSQWKGCDT